MEGRREHGGQRMKVLEEMEGGNREDTERREREYVSTVINLSDYTIKLRFLYSVLKDDLSESPSLYDISVCL